MNAWHSPVLGVAIATSILSLQVPQTMAQTSPFELIEQAQQAEARGDYAQASTFWQQLVDLGGADASDYYQLGVSYHRQMDLEKAISAYEEAIQLDSEFGSAYLNLGLAWMEARRYDKAGQSFQDVLSLSDQPADPATTHTLAHYNLAVIFKREGDFAAAETELQAALAISPEFDYAKQLSQQLDEDGGIQP